MAYSQETRQEMRRLYIFGNMPLEQAAAQLKIPYATASRWKQIAEREGDLWDKARAANTLAGGSMEDISRSILSGFLLQYQSTIDAIQLSEDILPQDKVQLLASLSDAFNKTVVASRRVLPETSELATAMRVVTLLGDFIKEKHSDKLIDFVGILDGFGAVLSKEFK